MCKINFRKPEMKDVAVLKSFFSAADVNACDYTPANIYLWSEVYHTEIFYTDNVLYIRYMQDGDYYFAFPFVKKHLKKAIDNLMDYCEYNNIEFKFGIIEPQMYEIIDRLYPGEFKVQYFRNGADYVYNIDELAALSGRKYHGKKNHVNKFKKTYENWSYETINDENFKECIDMVKEWCIENECCKDKSKSEEICVMINGLKHWKELSLKGGLIRVGERIVAVTLGEEVNKEMFVIHFEKAFASVQGAYPMINQQFILHELMDYRYVNREEDMGLEGLRKAKESYNPVFMTEKGVLTRKNA